MDALTQKDLFACFTRWADVNDSIGLLFRELNQASERLTRAQQELGGLHAEIARLLGVAGQPFDNFFRVGPALFRVSRVAPGSPGGLVRVDLIEPVDVDPAVFEPVLRAGGSESREIEDDGEG